LAQIVADRRQEARLRAVGRLCGVAGGQQHGLAPVARAQLHGHDDAGGQQHQCGKHGAADGERERGGVLALVCCGVRIGLRDQIVAHGGDERTHPFGGRVATAGPHQRRRRLALPGIVQRQGAVEFHGLLADLGHERGEAGPARRRPARICRQLGECFFQLFLRHPQRRQQGGIVGEQIAAFGGFGFAESGKRRA